MSYPVSRTEKFPPLLVHEIFPHSNLRLLDLPERSPSADRKDNFGAVPIAEHSCLVVF